MTLKRPNPDSFPSPNSLFITPETDDLSSHRHRQVIGWLGLILPILLYVIAGWRSSEGLQRWELLNSVSAYYHTGAVAAFVGILVALGVFLFTYRGYNNENNRLDRLTAIIAGVAAIGVAFFPTEATNGYTNPSWWTPKMDRIHTFCAVLLFSAFIFFSIFLFSKSKVKKGGPLPSDKRKRNYLYRFFGGSMLVCVVLLLVLKSSNKAIFWPEALALELFALSWLVKGRADYTLLTAGRRTLHYGLHPGQLVKKIRRFLFR